jgi:hypothetical protein
MELVGDTVVGNFSKPPLFEDFFFTYSFSANDVLTDWSKSNLISNFIADYSSYAFLHKDKAENLISTVLNEALESTLVFIDSRGMVDVSFQKLESYLCFYISVYIKKERVAKYTSIIEKINSDQLSQYYLDLMQTSWSSLSDSCFGLFLLAHDYSASLGYLLDTDTLRITTNIKIDTKEIDN